MCEHTVDYDCWFRLIQLLMHMQAGSFGDPLPQIQALQLQNPVWHDGSKGSIAAITRARAV